jgi:hypothetical protein
VEALGSARLDKAGATVVRGEIAVSIGPLCLSFLCDSLLFLMSFARFLENQEALR